MKISDVYKRQGHLVFTKNYTSKSAYVAYRHECAYIVAKGSPAREVYKRQTEY